MNKGVLSQKVPAKFSCGCFYFFDSAIVFIPVIFLEGFTDGFSANLNCNGQCHIDFRHSIANTYPSS